MSSFAVRVPDACHIGGVGSVISSENSEERFALGASLLALVAVLGGVSDRAVRQHNPAMNPRGWREGGPPG